jgi:UDP-4-amino-4,6-dideoxy-N-acetyl-beta-L-altrosamine transaminase
VIPYGRQSISEDDIAAVVAVLRSDWLTQGPAVPAFEEAVARACDARFAVAVSSGTAALHVACLAAGLGPGGLLWTSPLTFVASANCARYCGADVDFVDIDAVTGDMDPGALACKLETAEKAGRLPDVVVPVHFAGLPCDMRPIAALAERYGFTVVEDACHALGATYEGTAVGSSAFSAMTVLSFHPVKIVTTGEGGMVLTDDERLAQRLRLFRSHGITREPSAMEAASPGGWHYEMHELGYNHRLTDLQAALGSSQMKRLDAFVARRRELADRYDPALAGLPLLLPARSAEAESAWHLYVIRIDRERTGVTRRELYDALRDAGIGVNVHYIPVHTQPYYRRLGFAPGDLPLAEAFSAEALSLPLFPELTGAEQDTVVAALKAALG